MRCRGGWFEKSELDVEGEGCRAGGTDHSGKDMVQRVGRR